MGGERTGTPYRGALAVALLVSLLLALASPVAARRPLIDEQTVLSADEPTLDPWFIPQPLDSEFVEPFDYGFIPMPAGEGQVPTADQPVVVQIVINSQGGATDVQLVETFTPTPTPTATPTEIATSTPEPTATPQPTATVVAAQDVIPFPDQCWGDEQVFFTPPRPLAQTDITVAWSSRKRHDVRGVRLTGPVRTGTVTERQGLLGWSYEWTITPPNEGWYPFTFWVDVGRRCGTSGFNAEPVFGASPTPTPGATETPTPFPTATGTPTPVPPSISSLEPPSGAATGARTKTDSGVCTPDEITISGNDFGAAQGTGAVLIGGRRADVTVWTQRTIVFIVPSGLTPGATHTIRVVTADSEARTTYQVNSALKC